MTTIDYMARAELYLGRDWDSALAQGPRTFRTAAQAIRFALEEVAPVSLHGARLRIGEKEFSNDQLAWLYRSPDYPFARKLQVSRRRRGTNLTTKEPKWTSSTTTPRPSSTRRGAMRNRSRPSTGASALQPMPSATR